jgi:hypothetical protein
MERHSLETQADAGKDTLRHDIEISFLISA